MIADRIFNTLKSVVSNRVYPMTLPDGAAFPCIRYSFPAITEEPFVNGTTVILRYRVQIEVFCKTYAEALTLRQSIQTAMRAATGFIDQGTDFDDFEPDTKLYRWVLDFSFRD